MNCYFILFYFILLSAVNGQIKLCKDSFDISGKVGCLIEYKRVAKNYIWESYASKYDSNFFIINSYKMPLQAMKYYTLETHVYIDPGYKEETRALSDHLKVQPKEVHDSLIYDYLKSELVPNHFASGTCIKYKISPLQKWEGKYPYVDTEELYRKWSELDGIYHQMQHYRLLWVDSCQYRFLVGSYAYKKCKIPRERRYVRQVFDRLVESVYVRKEDELVELKSLKKH